MEIHDGTQRLQTAGLGVVRHRHAPARRDVQKPQAVQLPQSLVYHGLADLHLVRQLPLCGQAVAGPQLAGQDHALQLLHEQLLYGGGDDLTKYHAHHPFLVRPRPYKQGTQVYANSQ